MSSYEGRRWEVLLDDVQFIAPTAGRQFKALFEVLHDFGGFTSYCDLAIFNLSSETANNAFKRGGKLTLRCGYKDTIDTIFIGTIRNVLYERRGPDTITRMICRGGKLLDGDAQISETLGKNVKITEVIRACVKALGYPIVMDDSQFDDVSPYPRGQVLNGDPRVYLDNLARTEKFSYVVENEKVVIVRDGFFRDGAIHEVSQFTAMEGIPEITEVGADVTTRLSPKVRIGGRYQITSELTTFNFSNLYFVDIPESHGKGVYRIFRISHSGDTWGDVWSTKILGYR